MQKQYLPHKIEPKWQKKWSDSDVYAAKDDSDKQKYYLLVEFPYPSGARLHVGHSRSYCSMDSVARLKRMKGENVLYPMGWDAFGLPAENYAIKTGIHPSITVKENIESAKNQLISWGISFDWNREINTTDPNYYKWTQWIFLQLYKAGLAYRDEIAVNWCPSCKINLANEEVIDGNCERCGHETERRMQKQWLLKITEYAERLLKDLDTVSYRNDIKTQQINWIGKKEGAVISYRVVDSEKTIECFTTRPDTNFGATFVVLAPEHPAVFDLTISENLENVKKYVEQSMKRSELDRISDVKKKTGAFTGSYVMNPFSNEKMPIYVGDFVLNSVGTGAIVGVPGHDVRDFDFAQVFDLPVKRVVSQHDEVGPITSIDQVLTEPGKSMNSGFLNNLETPDAIEKMISHIEENNYGHRKVDYHLRDWVFSRQHYWGEPIPIIHCDDCGEVPVPEKDLPVVLPHVEKYEPTDTGESPLSAVDSWVNVTCPKCLGQAKRETDTMPNWAGSSWYYLRYMDPKNDEVFASKGKLNKWSPVDWYNGGLEHTTLHLLYSRFWHKVLFDLDLVPTAEPYARRTSHGVVLGPDGLRMSKSKGNVINPDDIIHAYGADALRLYIMFIGPFDQNVAWSNEAIMGVRRFLNRAWSISHQVISSGKANSSADVEIEANKLLVKVESDIENMKFNTVVAALMETVNYFHKNKEKVGKDSIEKLVLALATCAPHIAEELWELLGNEFSVTQQEWPDTKSLNIQESNVAVIMQVNGKFKGTIDIDTSKISEKYIVQKALSALNMREIEIDPTSYKYVPGKVVNFII